ncbi:MAG TPA: glutaredoxin family protein [Bacillales bacterium]|nr:glutaredoxin family protein [Bacillales bacterium]
MATESPVSVQFYTKENCPLCEDGLEILKRLGKEIEMSVEEIDIYKDDELLELYQLKIPVVVVNGEELDFGRLSEAKLRRGLIGSRLR